MVRISDARMSGTAYGTVVLHTAPGGRRRRAARAGAERRRRSSSTWRSASSHLHVSDEELAARRAKWKAPEPHADRGWVKLYCDTVQQADKGVDLDFLVGSSGADVGRPSH